MSINASLEERLAGAERRIADLARQKSRFELLNSMLTRLAASSGLENTLQNIISILMETIGAGNMKICYRIENTWKCRALSGEKTLSETLIDPRIDAALAERKPQRLKDSPLTGVAGEIPTEAWVFPLFCQDRVVGAVVMEQMQLTHENIMEDILPFFQYVALMLDNEINNFSMLELAHQTLQKSEERFRTMFDNSPTGIILIDPDGIISIANQTMATMFGCRLKELVGSTYVQHLLPSEHDTGDERMRKLINKEIDLINIDKQFVRGDGSSFWGHLSARRHEDSSGKTRYLFGHIADITERKEAEAAKKNMELQLLQSQKLESLGVLAGGIAHDFNNILTAIIGNADLALMRMPAGSPATDNLQKIEQSAGRAADLAKQMLAYSGKGKFVVEQINLNSLLEEMLHLLEVSISKKAILRLNLHEGLPAVKADATQMRQIIMNLVINASEAIGERSGVIAVTTGCMDCDRSYLKDVWLDENLGDGLYVYLEIADTGCGMDKETVGKLFDPFFTTKFTGRGLGMSAVLGIVRGHEGAIKVYSELGKGTSFKILLPASDKPAALFNGHTLDQRWLGSGTVLLVDDEETIRGIGAEMLKELGFTTITAADGREALEIFRGHPEIRFVILDLTMPRMDGEQCFRELRLLRPDVKVIMSSGYSEQEVCEKFMGKGLAGFIQKPYRLSALQKIIQKISD